MRARDAWFGGALVLVAAVALAPAAARAQGTAGYVLRIGADTLSMENVTRLSSRVQGEYVWRSPRSIHRTYTMEIAPDGIVRHYDAITRALSPGPGPAETRATVEIRGDSAVTTAPRGDSTVTTRVALAFGPGVPFQIGLMAHIEQMGRQARAAKGDTLVLSLVSPGSTRPWRGTVSKGRGDSLQLLVETQVGVIGPTRFALDKNGRLAWFDGVGTAFQAETRRQAAVDVAAARTMFATRPLGALSSRDTVRVTVGDSVLWVDYGRPHRRDREIFGVVVPWNTVWRTGANAATQFSTPYDVEIGGALVPAGRYTLWTLPTPTGWKLIVNKQTGQWGTSYDPAQDLVRVDMKVEALEDPVEQFTIAIDPAGEAMTMRMEWDRTRVSVPVRRR